MNLVVIAGSQKLFREGIKSMLGKDNEFEVMGEAQDDEAVISCVKKYNPDLLLLDASTYNIGVVSNIRTDMPGIKIIMLANQDNHGVIEAFKAGINGFCIKEAGREELFKAMRTVMRNSTYISPEIADQVFESNSSGRIKLKKEALGRLFHRVNAKHLNY